MSSDKHSKSRETEMIGTLTHGSVPVSDYYKQSVYDNHDNKIGDVTRLIVSMTGCEAAGQVSGRTASLPLTIRNPANCIS